MIKVKIKSVIRGATTNYDVNQVVDLDDELANSLINSNHAEFIEKIQDKIEVLSENSEEKTEEIENKIPKKKKWMLK